MRASGGDVAFWPILWSREETLALIRASDWREFLIRRLHRVR